MNIQMRLGCKTVYSRGTVRLGLVLILLVIGVLLATGFSFALDATNTTEFCTSCHSMQWVHSEYKDSLHYNNPSGVNAGCADCHVPKSLGPKLWAKIIAAKDVYHEIIGTIDTEEKFEAHRWKMANRVWDRMRATDSRECRSCHDYASMVLDDQDKSARKKHARAQKEGETCIECHAGVVHEEPDEPDDDDAEEEVALHFE